MYKILTLNNISVAGLERLPRDRYEVASEIRNPDAVMVRSASMHDFELPAGLKAIGRAGAGVNNIPLELASERGVAVFNAPGANANAVKELVLAGMLVAARSVCQAWAYVEALSGDDAAIETAVELGKKRYVGTELPGRTLGIIGLGAIGVQVANAAHALGMRVVGFDPKITVDRAWQLEAGVESAPSVEHVLEQADFVSLHVPLLDATRDLVNARRVTVMRTGAVLLNFARSGIVNDEAVLEALEAGRLRAYVCDFPSARLIRQPGVIALPHLGASTHEAEDNCAVMVAEQLRDYLEHGNVRNSVNLPETVMPRVGGQRLAVVHANVPNMLGQISTALADGGFNIIDMLNRSRGALAYTLLDVEADLSEAMLARLRSIDGVKSARVPV